VDLPLPALELTIHFVLFAAAAGVIGMAGLATVERLVDRSPIIQLRHVTVPIVLLVLSVIAERLYHALS
jgi:hypothetical protein